MGQPSSVRVTRHSMNERAILISWMRLAQWRTGPGSFLHEKNKNTHQHKQITILVVLGWQHMHKIHWTQRNKKRSLKERVQPAL